MANTVRSASLGRPAPTFGQNCHNAPRNAGAAGPVRNGATIPMRGARAVALLCAGVCLAAPATAQHLGPLVCGKVSYVGGTHVWTDYVFDDLGKNSDGKAGLNVDSDATFHLSGSACAGTITLADLAPGTLVDLAGGSAIAGPDGRATLAYPPGESDGAIHGDGDGVGTGDNCPNLANEDQLDRGGINTSEPDGIGDACQCGDVSGNGIVNGQDANAIKRHGLGLTPNPLFTVPGNCDVSGNGQCNGQDANAVKRAALGQPSPSFGQNCHNAIGAPLPPGL